MIYRGRREVQLAEGFPNRILFMMFSGSDKQDKIHSFGTISVITTARIINLSILNYLHFIQN